MLLRLLAAPNGVDPERPPLYAFHPSQASGSFKPGELDCPALYPATR